MLTMENKIDLINREIKSITSKNPLEIVQVFMDKDYINMHGPEHHYLVGASFLVAYHNAGGIIDIDSALIELENRSLKMPGAMCGYWGVCGSATSIGACFAIVNKTGPLSDNDFYKNNMEFISKVISMMSKIGGPRCCKRNAFLSIMTGVQFAKEKYRVEMDLTKSLKCNYGNRNEQCIKERCLFHN